MKVLLLNVGIFSIKNLVIIYMLPLNDEVIFQDARWLKFKRISPSEATVPCHNCLLGTKCLIKYYSCYDINNYVRGKYVLL